MPLSRASTRGRYSRIVGVTEGARFFFQSEQHASLQKQWCQQHPMKQMNKAHNWFLLLEYKHDENQQDYTYGS